MATFLDVTALQSFSVVFVFLFVWLFIYAVLIYTKVLGQNQIINILIGVLAGFFVIMSDIATKVVKQIAPVFAVVLVFIAIVAIASRTLGSDSMSIVDSHAMKYIVLVILVVALVVGALAVVRENINVPERGEDFAKTSTIIFHPNFLGIILIFLIAVFTVGLLAAKQT
ncbi:hypothetical protein HYU50_04165 [Candidatus Woesearchaeota archaeon]|nr:hypothetical protein [Candidatus Woesearchaeota archaeon]